MLLSLAEDELGLVVVERRLGELAAGDGERERRQVLAREIRRHVRRRESDLSVRGLHPLRESLPRSRALTPAAS
jgi:hypothetical protein